MTDVEKKSEILALQGKSEINTKEIRSALMNDFTNDMKIDAKILISMVDRIEPLEWLSILADAANKMAKKSYELIQKIHNKDKDDDLKILHEIYDNDIELDIVNLHIIEKIDKWGDELKERGKDINMQIIDDLMNENNKNKKNK